MKETSGNGYSKAEQLRLREASDRLCREYGLSVIEKPHKAPSRPVWLDEKSGKPTRYNVYRADVREAMEFSRTPYYQYGFRGYLVVITGTMTQNAITIKADGGKNGAGDTFQCGHSNEQRLCKQNDRAGCGNAGIEWHKYSEK